MLLYLGSQAAAQPFIIASQIFTALYFFYFIAVIPQRETIENFIRQDFLSL